MKLAMFDVEVISTQEMERVNGGGFVRSLQQFRDNVVKPITLVGTAIVKGISAPVTSRGMK